MHRSSSALDHGAQEAPRWQMSPARMVARLSMAQLPVGGRSFMDGGSPWLTNNNHRLPAPFVPRSLLRCFILANANGATV
jgi:hypothetical protein